MKIIAGLFAAAMALSIQVVMAAGTSLTLGVTLEPPHLDPTAGAAAAIDEIVYANVFEGLTRIDEQGRVEPALAESWDISADGKTYSFHLHKGVKFHDGADFDSSDVKFSIERAMAPASVNAQKGLFSAIERIDTPEPYTAVITLKHPEGQFLWNLGWGDAVMVDPASADTNKTDPVGTGPFAFKDWVKGDRVDLQRFNNYWGKAPRLDNVSFRFISDPAAQVAALMAGDVDAFPMFGAPESLARFEADPNFEVMVGSTEGETILALNERRKPWSDIRVRRALAHAIDRQAIIDGAMFGYGTPIGSHFSPSNASYVDLTGTYPYDPDKARRLLKEAGYGNGLEAVMKLPPTTYARRGGEIIASQLKAVGIDVKIVPVEWAQWLSDVFKGEHDFDFTVISHTEPLDIGIYARKDYYFGYSSERFDAVMKSLEEETNPNKRSALYQEAQKILAEDEPNIFLFELAKTGVVRKGLKGLWKNAPIQANDVTRAYWQE